MKIKKQKKRAEMTSTQIVTMILLIAGFAIILYVFNQVGFTKEIDREVCHESVILRMTLPDTLNLKNLPSLRCKTKKICITNNLIGKGDCEKDLGDKYETIKISKDKKEREKQINAFIAQELADCWSMMGEGKGQIFTRNFINTRACSICSRIAFDVELKEELKEVRGINNYLVSHKIPNADITYWKFLTIQNNIENYDFSFDNFSTEQKAIVFIEFVSGTGLQWSGAGILGTAVLTIAVISNPIGWVTGAALVTGATTVGWIGGAKLTGAVYDKYYAGWAFVNYDAKEIQDLKCDALENIP